jgi:transcription antitermination factor NusG
MTKRKGKRMLNAEASSGPAMPLGHLPIPKRRVEDIPEPPRARWIAVVTAPNRELDVHRSIRDAKFWSFYPQRFPTIRHARYERDGKCPVAYLPGYVFVQILPRQDWTIIEAKPHVIRVLRATDGDPYRLPDREIAALIAIAEPDGLIRTRPKPPPLRIVFDPGERVRIMEGPFAGFEAMVTEGVDSDGYLGVEAEVFRQPTPMRLEAGWVKRTT